jgi:hypothetical protein
MSAGGKLSRFSRAHLAAARLTLAEAPVDQVFMVKLPYLTAKRLEDYARETANRRETIIIEAVAAYLERL